MREIKFRAWDGAFMLDAEDLTTSPIHRKWLGHYDYPLMQYTGLKDKNGVEIYEGDVVIADNRRTEVIFREGEFKFKPEFNIDEEGEHFYTIQWEPVEVIGNIYENPELLTKEET